MADAVLCDEILVVLEERGPIKVDSGSEFKAQAGINPHWSNTAVKRALGSLISSGKVLRVRAQLQGCSDTGQPITYRLAQG